jgi:hypothetical protein
MISPSNLLITINTSWDLLALVCAVVDAYIALDDDTLGEGYQTLDF